MALLPRQDKDTAISAASEQALRFGGIKLRGVDIVLICIFAVLLCFTVLYLVLYRDPGSATRRLRKFPCFRNPFRSSAASGAQIFSLPASTDVKSPDIHDVERFPRPTFLLAEPSDSLGHGGKTRLLKWGIKEPEPRSGCTGARRGGLLPAVAGNSYVTDDKTRSRLNTNITSLPPAYLSFPAGIRS